ncbi:MAG: hypothetical protein ABJC98_16665 [Bacteroidota bacterium]
MEKFSIEYHNEPISIEPMGIEQIEKYRLTYGDGRWLVMDKRPDDTKTVATFNANISYSTASVWAVESKSEGPDWINTEQLQVIGELIARKEQEMENKNVTSGQA